MVLFCDGRITPFFVYPGGNGMKNRKTYLLRGLLVLLAAAFVSGLVGGLIGRKLFKKHFERAGIVS
jgi:hypothetical protein